MMDSIRTMVQDVMDYGRITKVVEINGIEFKLATLNTNDSILASTIDNIEEMKEEFGEDVVGFKDAFTKGRVVSLLSFAIVEMNGIHPTEATGEERMKDLKEFRSVLRSLPTNVIDEIAKVYFELEAESKKVFEDVEDVVGK